MAISPDIIDREYQKFKNGPGDVPVISKIPGYDEDDAFSVTINSADASSATQVKAGVSGKYIYITDIIVSCEDASLDPQIQDDEASPNVIIENMYLGADGGFVSNLQTPIKQPVAGADIDVLAAGAGNITVFMAGFVK